MPRSWCLPSRIALRAARAFTLDSRSLAAFRIAIGSIVCCDALLRTRDFSVMFVPDGMFPLAVLRDFLAAPGMWSVAMWLDATWWGGLMLVFQGLAGAAMAAGFATRPATVAAWVAVVSVLRRTAPATNAGDLWLACLLFWGMFLPLGRSWSIDAAMAGRGRRPDTEAGLRQNATCGCEAGTVLSAGSVALVLQIVAVYLASGLSKCNESWMSGAAISRALSVHDHGTQWGAFIGSVPWLTRPATWAVLAVELLGPVLLMALPGPRIRMAIVAIFMAFHALIATLMSVGLFAFVGMGAWLAILPAALWSRLSAAPSKARPAPAVQRVGRVARVADACCVAAGCLALVSLVHHNGPWSRLPLPRGIAAAINACCLDQDWGMFGEVLPQEQWVYARGETADGRTVDVLRGGRLLESTRPRGGFLSLPHHRWHKLFWELPRPTVRIFSPSIAATLARRWNESRSESSRLRSLEIRYVRETAADADGTVHELLLATWPPRDGSGRGNLDRLLEAGPDR